MDDDGVGKPFQLNFRVPWRGDSGMSDDVSLHSFDNVQRELNHLNVDIRWYSKRWLGVTTMQEIMSSLDFQWLLWRSVDFFSIGDHLLHLLVDDCCLGGKLILRRLREGRTTWVVRIQKLEQCKIERCLASGMNGAKSWGWGLWPMYDAKIVAFFRLDKMLKWSTDYFMGAHKSGGTRPWSIEKSFLYFFTRLWVCGSDRKWWGGPWLLGKTRGDDHE